MEQTLEIFRVIKIIRNHFTNLLAIILLFVIKPVRFPVKSPIEIQPVLFRAGDTHILIFFIYRPPDRVKKSIFDLVEALHSLPVLMEQWYWLISSNVGLAAPLMEEFGYIQ